MASSKKMLGQAKNRLAGAWLRCQSIANVPLQWVKSFLAAPQLVPALGIILTSVSIVLTYRVQKSANDLQKQGIEIQRQTADVQRQIETPFQILAKTELKNALVGVANPDCEMADDWADTNKKRKVSVLEFRHHRHVLSLNWEMYARADFCLGGIVSVFGSDDAKEKLDVFNAVLTEATKYMYRADRRTYFPTRRLEEVLVKCRDQKVDGELKRVCEEAMGFNGGLLAASSALEHALIEDIRQKRK